MALQGALARVIAASRQALDAEPEDGATVAGRLTVTSQHLVHQPLVPPSTWDAWTHEPRRPGERGHGRSGARRGGEAETVVRPAPHRWVWYALGGGLPARNRRLGAARHDRPDVVAAAHRPQPRADGDPDRPGDGLLPAGWGLRAAAAGGGVALALFYSLAYMPETTENRVVKAGYPAGTATAQRSAPGRAAAAGERAQAGRRRQARRAIPRAHGPLTARALRPPQSVAACSSAPAGSASSEPTAWRSCSVRCSSTSSLGCGSLACWVRSRVTFSSGWITSSRVFSRSLRSWSTGNPCLDRLTAQRGSSRAAGSHDSTRAGPCGPVTV